MTKLDVSSMNRLVPIDDVYELLHWKKEMFQVQWTDPRAVYGNESRPMVGEQLLLRIKGKILYTEYAATLDWLHNPTPTFDNLAWGIADLHAIAREPELLNRRIADDVPQYVRQIIDNYLLMLQAGGDIE